MSGTTILSPLGRAALAVGAAMGAFLNPARADLVAVVGDTTGGPMLIILRDRLRKTSECFQHDSFFVSPLDLSEFLGLPQGWLGHDYARFMEVPGFSLKKRAASHTFRTRRERGMVFGTISRCI